MVFRGYIDLMGATDTNQICRTKRATRGEVPNCAEKLAPFLRNEVPIW